MPMSAINTAFGSDEFINISGKTFNSDSGIF